MILTSQSEDNIMKNSNGNAMILILCSAPSRVMDSKTGIHNNRVQCFSTAAVVPMHTGVPLEVINLFCIVHYRVIM